MRSTDSYLAIILGSKDGRVARRGTPCPRTNAARSNSNADLAVVQKPFGPTQFKQAIAKAMAAPAPASW